MARLHTKFIKASASVSQVEQDIDHYITLLLGDISRLRDDENGYGPKGKGFIPHVDIPPEVEKAFQLLNSSHLGTIRKANPAFTS